jgi:DNA-directed RNA polymerase subunit RPC12/RpoP
MGAFDNQLMEIACSKCGHKVEKTLRWLKANSLLKCAACGHDMAAERTTVIEGLAAANKLASDYGQDITREFDTINKKS